MLQPKLPRPPSNPIPTDVPAPANAKVAFTTGMDGSAEFYFRAFRNPSQVLTLFVFTAVWTGIVYFLGHSKAPLLFTVVFGLADLLLLYGLILATLVSVRIRVENGKIVLRRALLGIGGAREYPFSEITQILPVTNAQQPGTKPSYSLRLLTRDGRKVKLADAIDNRQEARWVAAQLEKFAGLKLDTHVAVDAGLGNYGPPPQRGQAPSGSLYPFGAIVRPRSRWRLRSFSLGQVSSATASSLGLREAHSSIQGPCTS